MATTRKTAKGTAVIKTEKKKKAPAKAKKESKAGNWIITGNIPATKNKTEAIVLTSLAIGAAGVLGYLGWKYYKKKKGATNSDIDEALKQINTAPPVTDTASTPGTKTKRKKAAEPEITESDFPLKKGSKGEKVRQLQQALIAKYGSQVLPKYGADGDFGSETMNALKKNGLPTTVDESTFNVLAQSGSADAGDSSGLAKKIYAAVSAKNFSSLMSLLKGIQNKEQYQQVSNSFMPLRLGGVRQTLVNGLLSSFSGSDQKQKIRMEFIRMGLQYDGNKWSLSGFDGRSIVTIENASVWVSPTQSVPVPAHMVLGNEVTQRLDYTLFENNSRYFLIKTQSVKYL